MGLSVVPVIIVGATFGGTVTFLIARYFLADRVQRWIDRHPSMRVIADAVDEEGWRIVALLRFASPTPSSVQNYVFGVTRIGFWPYTLASLVFIIPQTVFYVYLGSVGRSLLLGDISSPLGLFVMLAGVGCLAATAFLVWRKARASLRAGGVAPRAVRSYPSRWCGPVLTSPNGAQQAVSPPTRKRSTAAPKQETN